MKTRRSPTELSVLGGEAPARSRASARGWRCPRVAPAGWSRRSTLKGVGSAAQDSGWRFGQGLAVQLCWGQLGRRTWGSRVRARACVWTAAGPRGCLLPGAPASAAGEPTPVCRWWAGLPVSRCPWSATAPAPGDGRCLHLLSGRACGYGSPPWGAGRGDFVSTSHIATSGQTTAHLCTNAVVGVKERRGTAGRCACPGLSRGTCRPSRSESGPVTASQCLSRPRQVADAPGD